MNLCATRVLRNESGFLLVAGLVLLAILTLVGTTAYLLSSTDIKIGGNFKNSERVMKVAIAGTEHGREVLRALNAASSNATSFNDELEAASNPPPSGNGTFELYASGSDDIPVVASTNLNGISYIVYLSNDAFDTNNGTPLADSNNQVLLTSVATGSNGAKSIIEITVSLPPPPSAPPPSVVPPALGAVTLLGNSATFLGGNSNAKALNGDDKCGSASALPVVAVNAPGSLTGIQSSINGSKPNTYHTKLPDGTPVTASTHMDAVANSISAGQAAAIQSTYGVDINSADSLNAMVENIQNNYANQVVPGGTSPSSVDLGTNSNPRVVVVDGDFTMSGNDNGVGMLIVKGQLNYHGNVSYSGIVMVIGKGIMIRNGAGNGTISGGIWVANTAGLDGVVGTADDTMGAAVLNTSGGGSSNIQHCSSAINNAAALTTPPPSPSNSPLTVSSFRQIS